MNTFKLVIATPDGELFSGDALSVLVKTVDGDVQIMSGHADYLAALATGKVKLTLPDGTTRYAASSGGFLSVSGKSVTLLATTFEFSNDIDVSRAERARDRAEKALAEANDEKSIKIAKAKLARALTRIGAASQK